jgi:hypothetical protein
LVTGTARNSEEQPAFWLFFCPVNDRKPRISAGNGGSVAVDFIGKTAKQQKAPRAAFVA